MSLTTYLPSPKEAGDTHFPVGIAPATSPLREAPQKDETPPSREVNSLPRLCAWRRYPLERHDIWLAIGLGLAAILVRLPLILHGEALLHSDEAVVGIMAQDIAELRHAPLYFYGQRYMGALEAYTIAFLRPLFADSMVSLRLGPACYLAVLVALQYLLLYRWFGRRAALLGATSLVVASPMFAQWSIAARGGYIEIFCLGTGLWWMYSEWFVERPFIPSKHKALLGIVIGIGCWLNPMIVAFVAPMVAHALLQRPLRSGLDTSVGRKLKPLFRMHILGFGLAAPFFGVGLIVLANLLTTVEVTSRGIEYRSLFGLVPQAVAMPFFFAALVIGAIALNRRYSLRDWMQRQLEPAAPFVFGAIMGSMPSTLYVILRMSAGLSLEDSLPLGIRPLATMGEPFWFALHGLPILFGADPKPFLELLLPGRSFESGVTFASLHFVAQAGGWIVGASLFVLGLLFLRSNQKELVCFLRLKSRCYSPVVFLVLALTGICGAYLSSGVVFDFSSVRYLLLAWLVLPGLIAATFVANRHRTVLAVVCLMFVCWGVGQFDLMTRIGQPHPLHTVAQELCERDVRHAVAEFQDAQYLSFLTQQRVRVAEFQSFWPRLAHYAVERSDTATVNYIVRTNDASVETAWHFPGPAPPETRHMLRAKLQQWLTDHPETLVWRTPLTENFELVVLSSPISERPSEERESAEYQMSGLDFKFHKSF